MTSRTSLLTAAVAAALPIVHGLVLHRSNGADDVHVEHADAALERIPTASWCIIVLCCQYVLIFSALAGVRTYHEITETAKGTAEQALSVAARTVAYSPMLCVLFIAVRMRVSFLTDGKEQPPVWVQHCMMASTLALIAQSFVVLAVPFVTGDFLPLPREGMKAAAEEENASQGGTPCFMRFVFFRYSVMLGLYGGIAGVITGIITYLPPGETSVASLPPPAPAVACTMILAVLYFGMEVFVVAIETYTAFAGEEFPKLIAVMNAAINTTAFAPMLSIVFLAARMRALQHGAQPQVWAQESMYAATYALAGTTALAVLVPLLLKGTASTDPKTNETTIEVPASYQYTGYALIAFRYLCLLGTYGGTGNVIYSIFVFESPKGPEHTVPVSPTVQCVVILCMQYFFIYLVLNIMHTANQVSTYNLKDHPFFGALEKAKATVQFAPMLSVLFVSTRSYALMLTKNKGAPQAWCQDGMYMATWACLAAFLICLATGAVMGEVKTDEDGNVINKFDNYYAGLAFTAARYITLLLMYGGMTIVVVGLILMTPETANGRGSIPLVTDAVEAAGVGEPPAVPGTGSFLGLSARL